MLNRDKLIKIAFGLVLSLALAGSFYYGYIFAQPTVKSASTLYKDPLQEIIDLERKAKDNPQKAELENLANSYYDYAYSLRQGEPEQAKKYFTLSAQTYDKVLAIDSNSAAIWTDMGTAYYYSEQMDKAEETYKIAVQKDPLYANSRLNYGIFLLYQRNDMAAAREQFTAVLKINPSMSDTIQSMIANAPGGQVVDYIKDIEPIIFQKCVRCHGPGGTMVKAPLHNYAAVMKYISPFDTKSVLLEKIKLGHPEKYSTDTISLIEKWIMIGAPGSSAR